MKKKRARRTPEQMIADLQAKIEQVKARAAAKEFKSSAGGKALIAAVKAIDKALEAAQEEGEKDLVRVLEASRAPLGEQMIKLGVRLPDRKKRRGRRRKGEAA